MPKSIIAKRPSIPRRCKLWPETIVPLCEAIANRPKPKDDVDAGFGFITKHGAAEYTGKPGGPATNEAIKAFKALDANAGELDPASSPRAVEASKAFSFPAPSHLAAPLAVA